MTTPAQQVPDGFELVSNGTARLVVNGDIWRLRRPKLGEYRKLRELLQERDDERIRLLGGQVRLEKPDDDASAEDKTEYTLTLRHRARDLADKVADLDVAWVTEALTMLADHALPPVDDWPAGMDSPEFIAGLVEHWRTLPLRSGGS